MYTLFSFYVNSRGKTKRIIYLFRRLCLCFQRIFIWWRENYITVSNFLSRSTETVENWFDGISVERSYNKFASLIALNRWENCFCWKNALHRTSFNSLRLWIFDTQLTCKSFIFQANLKLSSFDWDWYQNYWNTKNKLKILKISR